MLEEVRAILGQVLSLGERAKFLNTDSKLLGEVPELDSMAIVAVLTAMEENFGIAVEDDEISAETFATLGSLTEYAEMKING